MVAITRAQRNKSKRFLYGLDAFNDIDCTIHKATNFASLQCSYSNRTSDVVFAAEKKTYVMVRNSSSRDCFS